MVKVYPGPIYWNEFSGSFLPRYLMVAESSYKDMDGVYDLSSGGWAGGQMPWWYSESKPYCIWVSEWQAGSDKLDSSFHIGYNVRSVQGGDAAGDIRANCPAWQNDVTPVKNGKIVVVKSTDKDLTEEHKHHPKCNGILFSMVPPTPRGLYTKDEWTARMANSGLSTLSLATKAYTASVKACGGSTSPAPPKCSMNVTSIFPDDVWYETPTTTLNTDLRESLRISSTTSLPQVHCATSHPSPILIAVLILVIISIISIVVFSMLGKKKNTV